MEFPQQSAASNPDIVHYWADFCEAAQKRGDYAEVLRGGDALLRLAPDRPAAHYVRALALHRLDRLEESIEAYRRVIALDPVYIDAWVNLGHAYQALNRLDEAEDACRHAIAASGQTIADEDTRMVDESEYGNHHWNLAFLELLKGDLRRGLKRYPSRFKAIPGRKRPSFPQPLWRGEDLRGKSILITVDQGHGDTLMMARYLPLLRERRAHVILQAQPALVPLLQNWDGADEIIGQGQGNVPAFDYHASEFDLPHHFGTTLETIPAKIPYLPLPPPDDATRLPPTGKRKIGITWSGNAGHRNDKRRSVPLAEFVPLFTLPNTQFFALNRDLRAGDAEWIAQHPVTDLTPRLADFSATARFINQLDLVISCDTSVAHLAGGMGKPVWVLLPFAPSWCWMLGRADNLWYPTARLFRQQTRGDWAGVIDRVAAALKQP